MSLDLDPSHVTRLMTGEDHVTKEDLEVYRETDHTATPDPDLPDLATLDLTLGRDGIDLMTGRGGGVVDLLVVRNTDLEVDRGVDQEVDQGVDQEVDQGVDQEVDQEVDLEKLSDVLLHEKFTGNLANLGPPLPDTEETQNGHPLRIDVDETLRAARPAVLL